jgi:hypothetical protein
MCKSGSAAGCGNPRQPPIAAKTAKIGAMNAKNRMQLLAE